MQVIKARKKPIEVECVYYNGHNISDIEEFVGERVPCKLLSESAWEVGKGAPSWTLNVKTPNGYVTVYPFEYIIKGVNGEFYPCSKEVFEKTYDVVN